MQADDNTRTCTKCLVAKPVDQFAKSRTIRAGIETRCKSCKNSQVQQWCRNNPERYKEIRKRARKKWRENNREYIREHDREYRLTPIAQSLLQARQERHAHKKRLYARGVICQNHGISSERYEELLRIQDGVCAICRQPETRKHKSNRVWSLGIDHDHNCCPGRFGCAKCVRGLLCDNCNQAIGRFKENIQVLQNAVDYLIRGNNRDTFANPAA